MIPSRTGFAKGKLVSGSTVIMTGENFTFITGSIFNVPLQTKTAFVGSLTIKERLLIIIVTVFSGKGENSHLDAINCLLHVCIRISKYQKRSHTIRSDRQDLNKPSCQLFSQLNVIGDFSVSLRIRRSPRRPLPVVRPDGSVVTARCRTFQSNASGSYTKTVFPPSKT